MPVVYKNLAAFSLEAVHPCFQAAFADYIVDIKLSLADFCEMNLLRGVDLALSFGAFDGDQLVGFTLNAWDHWNDQRSGYDAGTGVIPAFRGQGISRELMRLSADKLRERGASRYILEVIRGNDKALALYQSLGFRETRLLDCLVLKQAIPTKKMKRTYRIEPVPVDRRFALEGLGGFLPAWQNSWNTLRRGPERYHVVAAWDQKQCLGFGAVMIGRGSIAQLWVRPEARRQGLGWQILQQLQQQTPEGKNLSWLNVDAGAGETLAFLKAVGFTPHISQYEMERILDA